MDLSRGVAFGATVVALAVPSAIAAVAAWGGALAQVDPLNPSMSQVDNLIAHARDEAEARGVDPVIVAGMARRGDRTLSTVTWPTGPNPVLVPQTADNLEGFTFEEDGSGYSFDEELADADEGFQFDTEPLPPGKKAMPPVDGGVW